MPLKVNPKLRSLKDAVSMTPEQAQEYIRCSQDIIYFANHYFYNIIKKDGVQDLGLINLFEFQKRMLKTMVGDDLKPLSQWDPRRHVCGMASRGSGKSTVTMLYFLWYFIFNENKKLLVLSKDLPSAEGIFSMFMVGYENLPNWMQPAVKRITRGTIESDNGCSVQTMATTENSARGGGFSRIFLDEFAIIFPETQHKFFEAVYPIVNRYDDAKMIIYSTPKGVNKFHEIFMDAKNGLNHFKPLQVNWWEWPGRDTAWKEAQIKTMGALTFNQEFGNKFLGSSQTLIDGEYVYRMEYKSPIKTEMNGKLLVYEDYDKDGFYILGADSSTGTGNDPAVIQVLRIYDINDIRQVAVFSDEYCPPSKFAEKCVEISKMYGDCEMIVEANSPGCGEETCRHIWHDLECGKLLNTDKGKLGTNPNVKSKLKACLLLKTLAEAGCVKIVDRLTIEELSVFEETKANTRTVFKAPKGKHDDRVTALYWALYYLITPFSEFDITQVRYKINEKYQEFSGGENLPGSDRAERRNEDWWGDGMQRNIPSGVKVPGEFENSFVSIDNLRKQAEMDNTAAWGNEFDIPGMAGPRLDDNDGVSYW